MNIGGNMKKKYLIAIILLSLIFIILFIIIGNKKSIVGKWKSIDNDNEYYYIFNNDKTCSYEMIVARLDCTYEVDDNNITILYKGNEKAKTYNYFFEGKNQSNSISL
jgi:hypothetical protein